MRKHSLSPQRRWFIELMSKANFGRIENLHIRAGEPQQIPPPRIIYEKKMGGDNRPRTEGSAGDFHLKEQVVELFDHFDEIRDGVIDVIEIKHGLPFKLEHVGRN